MVNSKPTNQSSNSLLSAPLNLFSEDASSKLIGDRYRLLKLLGHGSFGCTFLAVDEAQPSNPPFAIKQFCPQTLSSSGDQAAELFRQEAEQTEGEPLLGVPVGPLMGNDQGLFEGLRLFSEQRGWSVKLESLKGANGSVALGLMILGLILGFLYSIRRRPLLMRLLTLCYTTPASTVSTGAIGAGGGKCCFCGARSLWS